MLNRHIIETADGSSSVHVDEWNVTYHSIHGATQECMHVFIEAGLGYFMEKHQPTQISILEMGFGTGLNALLTLEEAERLRIVVHYETVEAFPLPDEMIEQLSFAENKVLQRLHKVSSNKEAVTPFFNFVKHIKKLEDFLPATTYDIVYFDAFAPETQPELWTEDVFKKLFDCMNRDGVLVTYCSKSIVRKAMQAVGFVVEKIPGPLHKREMVRAIK